MKLDELKEVVEEVSGVPDISTRDFHREYTLARWVFWRVAEKLGHSINSATKFLGFKSHQSALNGIKQHTKSMIEYDFYKNTYEAVYLRVFGVEAANKIMIPQRIINKLSLLSPEELLDFEKFKLNPHLQMMKII